MKTLGPGKWGNDEKVEARKQEKHQFLVTFCPVLFTFDLLE